MLIAEYGVTPDVFAAASYSCPEVCDLHLKDLKDRLLSSSLVRDFRNGEWSNLVSQPSDRWHMRGKELLKKLSAQGRLIKAIPSLKEMPVTDEDWCREALGSHTQEPLHGIIASKTLAAGFKNQSVIASVEQLDQAQWWQNHTVTVLVRRSTDDYLARLHLVLRYATHVMFIDPHLDPETHSYREFGRLLAACRRANNPPLIEIHRVCFDGPNKNRIPNETWERKFRTIEKFLQDQGLSVRVFIWDDIHNRYLISNLIGISMGNGFDTTNDPRAFDTWSQLPRNIRDEIQRKYDIPKSPAGSPDRYFLHHNFWVGCSPPF